MTKLRIKIILTAALLLLPFAAWSQKQIYTRSYMIRDFKGKTTRVVLDESCPLSPRLRQEVSLLWSVSPYEFCSPDEYESKKNSPECYFLRPEIRKGIFFLTLSRGGAKDAADALKRPVEVISIPVAGASDPAAGDCIYMPAFISLIQDFTEVAMDSELAAYRGLNAVRKRRPLDIRPVTVAEEAREAFLAHDGSAAVQVLVSPDGSTASKPRYRYVIGAGNYELYSYGKN